MARKSSTSAASAKKKSTKRAAGTSSGRTARKIASAEDQADVAGQASAAGMGAAARGGKADMGTMAALLSPEQAIELYKTNARMALDVINAAIESTAKLRKLQLSGEESARELGMRTARGAASAKDPQSLAAVGQEAGREAVEKSLVYWAEMFDLIVEMQKRLFTLINQQATGLPGFPQAKAAMALMPDLTPMKSVVEAMQGMVGAGSGAFTSMQKMMGDMARMAQSGMPAQSRRENR